MCKCSWLLALCFSVYSSPSPLNPPHPQHLVVSRSRSDAGDVSQYYQNATTLHKRYIGFPLFSLMRMQLLGTQGVRWHSRSGPAHSPRHTEQFSSKWQLCHGWLRLQSICGNVDLSAFSFLYIYISPLTSWELSISIIKYSAVIQ